MGGFPLQPARRRLALLVGVLSTLIAGLAGAGGLPGASGVASAATLVGGRQQTLIDRAFSGQAAHHGQVIVSTRVSTVNPAWSVVKSVAPSSAGQTAGGSVPQLRSTYYHRVGARERTGRPPRAVLADLDHRFTVDVQYSGSGSETVTYDELDRGVCAGLGGFTDQQQDTVAPMSWVVRYEIDPDQLLSAVRSRAGTVLVPRVTFLRAGSSVTATERLQRSVVDLSCAGATTRWSCTERDALAPSTALLSFPPGDGLEIGVPVRATGSGQCPAVDYTLPPSLWDSGATTALVGSLGVDGGQLPSDPYAPIPVTWPAGSAQQALGFVASPCQGITFCVDSFDWTGAVALVPADGA